MALKQRAGVGAGAANMVNAEVAGATPKQKQRLFH